MGVVDVRVGVVDVSFPVRVPNTAPNTTATIIAANIAAIVKRILFFLYQGLYKERRKLSIVSKQSTYRESRCLVSSKCVLLR
jgi:hypothetical protein